MRAALFFAAYGVPVLPLHTPEPGGCSCGDPRCTSPGKHPRLRHGVSEASTDPRLIDLWWRRWPTANLGLRTGVVMDVADVDSDEGRRALIRLLGGRTPAGPAVRSGSGGWHFWYAPTGHGNRVRLLPDVDWRGSRGYVVAPPSRHASGNAYAWLRRPFETALPVCPLVLRDLITGPPPIRMRPPHHPDRYAQAALTAEVDRVAAALVGARNDTLNRAAYGLGRLVGAGLLGESAVLRELATAAGRAGLGPAETVRTIRSGLRAGIRDAPGRMAG